MENVRKTIDIASILARLNIPGGKLTPREEQMLAEWLADDDRNRRLYDDCRSGALGSDYSQIISEYDRTAGWQKISADIPHRRPNRRRKIIAWSSVAVAAVALIAGVIISDALETIDPVFTTPPVISHTILAFGDGEQVALSSGGDVAEWEEHVKNRKAEMHDTELTLSVKVPAGGEYKLLLPDGTVVRLNSQTTIKYPEKFAAGERRVRLSGEAYLEVAHDPQIPFIVETPFAEIEVLGTVFNVSAYPTEPETVTTLVEGRVAVSIPVGRVELSPGQQARVSKDGHIGVEEVDPSLYTSWTDGVFEFRNMTLEDICRCLSRWYNVEFEFRGDSEHERFTGGILKYMPLAESLGDIERVTDVVFEYRNNKVTVKRK